MKKVFVAFLMLIGWAAHAAPSWMLEQIGADLAPFEEGITQEALDDFAALPTDQWGLYRFKIVGGVLHTIPLKPHPNLTGRAAVVEKGLRDLAKIYSLPDVDFLCSVNDYAHIHPMSVPIFVFAKHREKDPTHILIPDYEALQGYGDLEDFVRKGEAAFPWEMKEEIGFWRGSTTGGWAWHTNRWKSMPRAALVLLSLDYPDYFDARFTNLAGGSAKNPDIIGMHSLLGEFTTPLNSLKYKYLIDVDGNTCGYARCFWTLQSNSVVIKQVSENVQWYYKGIKPYEHYIPVANDFSDLIEKIQWARSHDQEAKQIAANATYFVLNDLRREDIDLYLYLLLVNYAKLQKFQPAIDD